ncbi:hypothetical protein FGG08_002387 [Glutinoglossum americanum]|uniref:Vacuolar protein sorting-associated protein 51 homolog n=1 Tax=Glutinoglossum americanum TaxID=1670608 RepID=A0A9P8I0C2_9PEZI|nr:hypothetical protein FGG08_002387 [Glutinoglossum americanum]
MSTISSPRPSIATPSSSRRASLDNSQANSPSRPPLKSLHQPRRGNRAALRDYYGLKANDSAPAVVQTVVAAVEESEMDREGFSVEEYLERVMEKEGLEGMLSVEGGLVNEIRGLDGERKALVYDNYSKLIAATDTIRKVSPSPPPQSPQTTPTNTLPRQMRTNMDPLTPTTSTLPPALSHIAETASTLATTLQERTPPSPFSPRHPTINPILHPATTTVSNDGKRREEVRTVKWVLDAPRRVRVLVGEGRREEAEREWGAVRVVLEGWEGVRGVEGLRREGEEALRDSIQH